MTEKEKNIEKKTCPNCGSKKLIKKGIRKNKLKEVQLFFCKDCSKKFTDDNFKNRTYNIAQIVKAITLHNKGFTIEDCSDKTDIPSSTISNWILEYKDIFDLYRFSGAIRKFKLQNKIIETHKYDHGVIYLYQHHKFKLEKISKPALKGLYKYLNLVKSGKIDKQVFANSLKRASDAKLNILDNLNVVKTNNNICTIAKMAVEIASENRKRHWFVEKTMLDNDTATIATEIPVYLDTSHSNMPFLKSLATTDGFITGHIDILQVKNDCVYILDYKPNAQKEKPLGQLFVYACCLSRLAGVHFAKIKLAWFDESDYFETDAMDIYKNVMKIFKR
jgi:transposase-like protein